MSKRKNDAFSEVIVGFFMTAVFALLVYFTIVISGVELLQGKSRVHVVAHFGDVATVCEQLERMTRADAGSFDLVDFAHASFAEKAHDFVITEFHFLADGVLLRLIQSPMRVAAFHTAVRIIDNRIKHASLDLVLIIANHVLIVKLVKFRAFSPFLPNLNQTVRRPFYIKIMQRQKFHPRLRI